MSKIIIVSGFSGSGKGTIVKVLLESESNIWLSKSDTDRKKRNNTDYYNYISTEEFIENMNQGIYMEYNKYGNNHYATRREPVLDKLKEGYDVLLEIDVNGMRMIYQDVKKLGTEIISIFVVCDADCLKKRLVGRGDSPENINRRMGIAIKESRYLGEYDYVLFNDTVENSVGIVKDIIYGKPLNLKAFDDEKFRKEMRSILEEFNL